MSFRLLCDDFVYNGEIPEKYTCDGEDAFPELTWTDVPKNTKSLVLIIEDPDTAFGTWDHFVLFNIPADINLLEYNIQNLPKGARLGKNSWNRNDYGGPCPPDKEHRYYFRLFALDIILDLEEGTDKLQIKQAMQHNIIDQTELMGRYTRKEKK